MSMKKKKNSGKKRDADTHCSNRPLTGDSKNGVFQKTTIRPVSQNTGLGLELLLQKTRRFLWPEANA